MEELRQLPACSAFLSDFLDYIQNSMMVLDPSERNKIGEVTNWLGSRFKDCLHNQEYALMPHAFREPLISQSKRKYDLDGVDEPSPKR